MLLINYQKINLKQILCVAKNVSQKRYFALQKPKTFRASGRLYLTLLALSNCDTLLIC